MTTLLTVTEAAERISCSRYLVYDLIADGKLTHYDVGRGKRPATRVSESEVEAYIEASRKPIPTRNAS